MPKNTKREDGRLQSRVYIGLENGKKKYKYVYAKNQRELDRKITELRTKLGKGVDPFAERDTFGQWCERWLRVKKSEISAKWYETLCSCKSKLESISDTQVTKLRQIELQEILMTMAADGYSRKTIKAVRDMAANVMQLAVDNRVTEYNTFATVKLPKEKEKITLRVDSDLPAEPRRALTDEEQAWIRDTPHRAQTSAMIMMYAGLRRGELLALLWSDIDLEAGTIDVNKSVETVGNAARVKSGGKTYSATRTVYIPKLLTDYLSAVPGTHFGNVVTKKDGKIMTATAWRRLWDSYLDDLNLKYGDWENCAETSGKRPSKFAPGGKPMLIPRFTAHWLRHTFITLMYLAGVDVLTAKEQAGHADIKTTLGIYTHLDQQHKKQNISQLDELLSKKLSEKIS